MIEKLRMGFEWQSGMEKCTEGIWLWSQPFVFPATETTPSTAVLLMDTQGAWDSSMSKEQSATIFGLTALLSSKLIYNVQNRISEDKFDNLDYFMTYAQSACSSGAGAQFGELDLLIRDWENYEDGENFQECMTRMGTHLNRHIDPDQAQGDRKETLARLKGSFRAVQCFGLPHPGKKVPKSSFKGEFSDLDTDFLVLLDHFMHHFFNENFPTPSAPLGCELTPDTFERVVTNFVHAFHQNQGSGVTLREAYVKCELFKHKEQLAAEFKKHLSRAMPETAVVDPDDLKTKAGALIVEGRKDFEARIKTF